MHFKNIDLNSVNVVADKNRIPQVISNLKNNSIKFISTGNGNERDANGLISITVEKAKIKSNEDNNSSDRVINGIIISIKINGIGINPEIFPGLFTKFASKSFQGTGLGLYISKNIVEAHGGNIWAKNNENGKGAIFFFTLALDN